MNNQHRSLSSIGILLMATLACSLPGSLNPGSTLQTLIPDEAQTLAASAAQTLVASVMPPAATDPAGSGGLTSSACNNTLYPVVLGASWIYSVSGPLPDTFTRSISDLTDVGFSDQDVFGSGTTRSGQWTCEAGALTALNPTGSSGNSANVQTSGMDSDFKTTSLDGVTYPAEIVPGISWSQNFTLEGVQNLNGQEIPSKNETAYTCTAGDYESVSVPSGTFDAIRVDCQVEMLITITMSGVEIPTSMNSSTSSWFAAGMGLVKSTSDMGTGQSTIIELTAYNIP